MNPLKLLGLALILFTSLQGCRVIEGIQSYNRICELDGVLNPKPRPMHETDPALIEAQIGYLLKSGGLLRDDVADGEQYTRKVYGKSLVKFFAEPLMRIPSTGECCALLDQIDCTQITNRRLKQTCLIQQGRQRQLLGCPAIP